MAAVCLMMQFATMDRAKYDDVMKALDWQNTGSLKGLISHMAGPMQCGTCYFAPNICSSLPWWLAAE